MNELAEEVDKHYAGREFLIVVVLKGAFVFAADLVRFLRTPVEIDFVRLESYRQGTVSSGEVHIKADLCSPVSGREVLIVEDIVDTGLSMNFLAGYLRARGAANVKICALLDKRSRREVDIGLDFVGFEVPDVFVVGYGIDCAQRYRSLPDIYEIQMDR